MRHCTAADDACGIKLAPRMLVCSDDQERNLRGWGPCMQREIDYYFSFQSPWAYIGHKPFRDVVTAYDLKVNHKPVVLVDLFSETGGLPLMKRHPVRQRYRMVELQRWRDKRGLKFHLQPANWPFNARLADGVVRARPALTPTAICGGHLRRCGKTSSTWPTLRPSQESPTNPGFPASNWSNAPDRTRSARPTSRTVRKRWRRTCSARRFTCSTARCFGDRTGSNCWRTR